MTASLLVSAIAILASLLPLGTPDVDADPFHRDGVIIWDEGKTDPEPIPITNPVGPRAPAEPAPTVESDPFFCRPEAPFPQDGCIPPPEPEEPAEPVEPDAPAVTPGDVVEAVRRIGLPRLTVAVQPAGSTLVNLDTILYTTAAPFERTVPMLGSTVELQATPATYTWHHGDGTTQTTSRPGRPYPALDVTYQYRDAGSIAARVDVAYRVTFRIDGGAWQDLGTTITAEGPATALRVREARPVLTD